MNPFDKILVKTPKFSRYDQHNTNKLTMDIGDLVPIWFKDMTPNESIRLRLRSLVKTTPMLAPIMDRLKLETFAFFVPYRILGWDSEKFFNLSTPVEDRPRIPQLLPYPGTLAPSQQEACYYNAFDLTNRLIDYLGLPNFQQFQDNIWSNLNENHDLFSFSTTENLNLSTSSGRLSDTAFKISRFNNFIDPARPDEPVAFSFVNSESAIDNGSAAWKFYGWLWWQYDKLHPYYVSDTATTPSKAYSIGALMSSFSTQQANIDSFLNIVLPALGYESVEAALTIYRRYIVMVVLSQNGAAFPSISAFRANTTTGQNLRASMLRSALTKRVYHRIVADWFLNTNIEDYDQYLDDYVYHDYTDQYTSNHPNDSFKLRKRCWENDYFTSAFANTQSGTDVPIPVNGSIKDLRNANALQRVMELVLYSGRRYIDQIKTFFGAKSSDARLDRAEVLGKSDFVFGIDEVVQQSESSFESKLGSYAGRGLTAGSDGMFNYKAEEHGMIMILANIKPLVSYMHVTDRFYLKSSPYDFLLPQFAQVGEQPIYMSELYEEIPYSESNICEVFGFQRRYAEYMFKHNEVHGEFLRSLDYWTMARRFDTKPALNSEFIHITKADDYNRVFAVPDGPDHFMCYFVFDFNDVNAIPRYLNYDL